MDTIEQRWPAQPGIAMALGSALLFGLSTPAAKLLLTTTDPWLTAGLLYLGAGAGLAATRLVQRAFGIRAAEASLRACDLPRLAAIVFAGGVCAPALLMFGLARIGSASASLLLNLEAIATLGIAWLVFREHVDRRLLLGAFCILVGAVLLSIGNGGIEMTTGALLVALACLAWGIDNNLTRKVSAADPVQIAMIKGLVAGAVNLAGAFAAGVRLPVASDILAAGIVGYLGYGVSLVLFVVALRHLGTARAGAYFALAPFVGALVGVVILAEPLDWKLIAAGGLMAGGLWLHLSEWHAHEHEHEAVEHDHGHIHDAHHHHAHGCDENGQGRHAHRHAHLPLTHRHPHYPDLHHRHRH